MELRLNQYTLRLEEPEGRDRRCTVYADVTQDLQPVLPSTLASIVQRAELAVDYISGQPGESFEDIQKRYSQCLLGDTEYCIRELKEAYEKLPDGKLYVKDTILFTFKDGGTVEFGGLEGLFVEMAKGAPTNTDEAAAV